MLAPPRLVVWSQEFDRRLMKVEQGVFQVNAERKAAVLGHERGQALLTQPWDGPPLSGSGAGRPGLIAHGWTTWAGEWGRGRSRICCVGAG
jgi:hypothetical protein